MPPQGQLRVALDTLDPSDPRTDEEIIQAWRDDGLVGEREERFIPKELEQVRQRGVG